MPASFIAAVGAAAGTAAGAIGTAFSGITAVFGAGGALASGTLLGAVARVGLGIGLSLLARQFQPKPTPTNGQIEFSQAVPPRIAHYGRVKVAGYTSFHDALRYNDGVNTHHTLVKNIMISARKVSSFLKYYIQDKEVTRNIDGEVITEPYIIGSPQKRMVSIYEHLGTDTQTADPFMLEAWPGIWTADHRGLGIAYAVVVMKAPTTPANFSDPYPGGEPTFNFLIEANEVYDPRLDGTVPGGAGTHRINDKTTWAWSDNVSLCILDWLTHPDNYARPIAEINLQSFMDFADLCDEEVLLGSGLYENRYRVAMTYEYTEPRKQVLRRLLDACDGHLYKDAAGKYGIRGGEWVEPTVTISDVDHHIYAIEIQEPDGIDRYNELTIHYMSPSHGYVEQECDPWLNEADIAETGEVRSRAFDLTNVPSYTQARRLSKIRMAKDNPDFGMTARTDFYGLNCIGEEVITIVFSEFLLDGPCWMQGGPQISDDMRTATLQLRTAVPEAYDWSPIEEGEEPALPADTSEYTHSLNYTQPKNAINAFVTLFY